MAESPTPRSEREGRYDRRQASESCQGRRGARAGNEGPHHPGLRKFLGGHVGADERS